MNVLAINGSPRLRASSTYSILVPLLEGMRAGGAETNLIHVRELNLEPCLGCFHCWTQTPGECIHNDGMKPALDAYRAADLVVFDPATVTDNSTYEEAWKPTTGMHAVIVNGTVVVDDSKVQRVAPGVAIRKEIVN